MKLLDYFDGFLTDVVNLNQTRLDQLDSRVDAIVAFLKADTVIGTRYENHIPQGSWAHRTIIRPLPDKEFDADFLLLIEEDSEWSKEPKVYLQQLRAAFRRSTVYADKVRRKNRCVRIGYANDCHVDVVPHLILADGRQVIVNHAENQFEDTNPEGFTDWMKEKDALARGYLRKVIRLMKYLRDFKGTFSCPSVILTTLLGSRVQAFDAESRYADLPTTLVSLISDLDAWLQLYPTMTRLEDPSCPGTTFNHRWDQDRYSNFRSYVRFYADRMNTAYREANLQLSLEQWQSVFGTEFKKRATTVSNTSLVKAAIVPMTNGRAPLEEFIEEKGLPRIGGYMARIRCTVEKKRGFRHGDLRTLRRVSKHRSLLFELFTDVPGPYDLYWKVRNTGREAEEARALRGQLLKDDGGRGRREETLYHGQHYVEAYVVKNGKVVASDHQNVTIE